MYNNYNTVQLKIFVFKLIRDFRDDLCNHENFIHENFHSSTYRRQTTNVSKVAFLKSFDIFQIQGSPLNVQKNEAIRV